MRVMKMILIGVLLLLPMLCQAQKNLYEKYKEMNGVSAVYISKAMLDMAPGQFGKDMNLGKVSQQLNSLRVLSTMDNNIKKEMRKDIRALVQSSKYELLMEQKSHVSSTAFYVHRKGDKVKELIMIVDGPATLKFVYLEGNMVLKDIQNIMSHSKIGIHINGSFPGIMEGIRDLADANVLNDLKNLEKLHGLKDMTKSKDFEFIKKYIDEETWKCFEKSMNMISN